MSILINNDLIWISVPRCASFSIEKALMESKLNVKYLGGDYIETIKKPLENNETVYHYHFPINYLYDKFGYKKSVCITRDWFERWLSALEHAILLIKNEKFTPIIEWKDMDNDFIYDTFDIEFSNNIYSGDESNLLKSYSKLIKEDFDEVQKKSQKYRGIVILTSQNYWKSNKKCDYEFDIKELDKFETFISNRYDVNFKIPVLNRYIKSKNKIVADDKLKNFIWNLFEKPFFKNKSIL